MIDFISRNPVAIALAFLSIGLIVIAYTMAEEIAFLRSEVKYNEVVFRRMRTEIAVQQEELIRLGWKGPPNPEVLHIEK